MRSVTVDVLVEQKQHDAPAFVTVPASKVARWKLSTTTTIDGTLDGAPLGRHSLRRWDEQRWFIELPKGLLDTIDKRTGARATLVIFVASSDLPAELKILIETNPAARECWEASTEAQRRMLREHVLGAKSCETRARRARRALVPAPRLKTPRIVGLEATPKEIVVQIVGKRLPGRSCGPYTDVSVGLVHKVGCDPKAPVPADVRRATWETKLSVRAEDGRPAFRGPAVNGPPHERFLYLTWIGRLGGDPPAMFRRAKLRLDSIPSAVLAAAIRSGLLVGQLDLTAADGMPVAASVKPPNIVWASS